MEERPEIEDVSASADRRCPFEDRLFRLQPGPTFPVKCGRGWLSIVAELDRRLSDLDPVYELFQVEQKFGALVVHARPSRAVIQLERCFDELILDARAHAAVTCEECGQPGELRAVLGWMAVLCRAHHGEYLNDSERL